MPRFDRTALLDYAAALLTAGGMEADKAAVTAEILVEGDMIGHDTHGLQLMHWYLECLADGSLNGIGSYEIVADKGAAFVWDGRLLPGAWLLSQALDQAMDRVRDHGIVGAAIRNCHHTCALSAYMRRATDRGLIVQLSVSNPAARRMAPYGGTRPIMTPNPLAMGFPTSDDPILVDISSSITTTTMTQLLAKKGERYPEAWGLTAEGRPTDDPREITERGGTMMPLGGASKGHKGYGLALIVDLLGQGLSGKGRANTNAPGPLAQSAFLQVIDPAFFAGLGAFTEQSDWLADACRTNPPAPWAGGAVRVPGDAASARRRDALQDGVPVAQDDWVRMERQAGRLGVTPPQPIRC
ncbi:Ldh family oxidoreductase [Paracoccus sediminis]|uniref:L-lactate dehydrogenase n=1 Tax=Paracoccus sediminis TaxID=1214787 RepID=A0A238XS97_9RHOB|nr:Ldh family oxidoreductase [Paracoccus sediminis]TBN47890.1 Ldh family oxidoreductase [Paracoccus sediminis]SNR61590.1 L-lactate dehydrogenase [Paracoccus sediminis]